jgi:PAS domain S-box-containing protein
MKFDIEKFRRLRIQMRWSLSGLSKNCGISRKSLSLWENGKKTPSEKKVRELAEFLNIDISEISDLERNAPVSISKLKKFADFNLHHSSNGTAHAIKTLFDGVNCIEKELKNKDIIIEALLKSINTELYIKDTNLNYIAASDSFIKNLKLNKLFSICGKRDSDFLPSREVLLNEGQDLKVLQTGKPIVDLEGFIPGTRKKRWGIISKIPIFDSLNAVMGIVGVFVDITERKMHENVRELLEINIETMSDSMVIRDCETGKYLYVNTAAEDQFGYPISSFAEGGIQFWLDTCIHPEERDLHYSYFNSKKWPPRREYRVVLPDGTVKWLEGSISFQYYKGKECFVAINRDITERKMNANIHYFMEEALKDSSQYVLWVLRRPPSLKTVYVSESVNEVYGYPAKKFIKENNFWLNYCLHKDDKGKLAKDWYEGVGGYIKEECFRIVKPSGEIRWIECFSSKIFDDYVVYMEKDVTESVTKIKSTKVEVKKELAKDLLKNKVDKEIIFKTTGVRF